VEGGREGRLGGERGVGGRREKAAVCEVETQSRCVPRLNALAYIHTAFKQIPLIIFSFSWWKGTNSHTHTPSLLPSPSLLSRADGCSGPSSPWRPSGPANPSSLSCAETPPSSLPSKSATAPLLSQAQAVAASFGTCTGWQEEEGGREGGPKGGGKEPGNLLIRCVRQLIGAPPIWNGRPSASSPSPHLPPPPRGVSWACGTFSKSTQRRSRWVSGERVKIEEQRKE